MNRERERACHSHSHSVPSDWMVSALLIHIRQFFLMLNMYSPSSLTRLFDLILPPWRVLLGLLLSPKGCVKWESYLFRRPHPVHRKAWEFQEISVDYSPDIELLVNGSSLQRVQIENLHPSTLVIRSPYANFFMKSWTATRQCHKRKLHIPRNLWITHDNFLGTEISWRWLFATPKGALRNVAWRAVLHLSESSVPSKEKVKWGKRRDPKDKTKGVLCCSFWGTLQRKHPSPQAVRSSLWLNYWGSQH